MSAQWMEVGRTPCTTTSILSCTPDQLQAAASGYLGYTGTFTVEENRITVTHRFVVAFNPRRVGTDQVRQFEFLSQDRL
jgi:Lipocalin-like domain